MHNKLKKGSLFKLLVLYASLLMALTACGGKLSIAGKWEQISEGPSLILFGGPGTLWEFFDDGTVSIGVMGNVAGKYSWPDDTHLKIEFAQGQGLVYEFTRSENEITLKDPSIQSIVILRRYEELSPSPQSLAGTWQKGSDSPDESQCFSGLGLDSAPRQVSFAGDGTFSAQEEISFFVNTSISLHGQFSLEGNTLRISATGTKTESLLGETSEEQIGGELVCQVTVSHSRLLFRDNRDRTTLYVRAQSSISGESPTPTPGDILFMGVQLGGGAQAPSQSRPALPLDYCNVTDRQGPAKPPAPFLYQPFEGSMNEWSWTSQMDHDQPVYRQNGLIATLGEVLRYDESGPGLAGGTEVHVPPDKKRWFEPRKSYEDILKQGYYILAYQSPSFETYQYYDGHDGHDFAVTGKALAAADGSVEFKGDYGNALGRVVEIRHPNGYLTRYAHLASFESGIEVGAQVEAGQPIGTIGGSAVVGGKIIDNYWGMHLHFSVFRWTGSEWHITDPFGWDPWAGPDRQSHLRKQREDPLVHCNGEVSYNLWVGGWPQPVTQAGAIAPFYPTQDRYVGGWLGAQTVSDIQQQTPSPVISRGPIFSIVPFHYFVEDVGEGWNEEWIALAFTNISGQLLDPLTIPSLTAEHVSVETEEGKEYLGELVEIPGNPSSVELDGIDIDESDILPVPPNLTHWTTRRDYTYTGFSGEKYQNSRYWIRFRFAYAAHPTRVKIHFTPQGIISEDEPYFSFTLSSIGNDPPLYEPSEVKPISELQGRLSFDKPGRIRFQLSSTCLVRYNEDKKGWHLYLPYSAVNQNQLDQEIEQIEFGYALWFPYGAWDPEWKRIKIQLGPGQRVDDVIELESWESYSEPLPEYLILYEPIGTYGVYEKTSVYAIQCEEQ
jgi:hypothetical protein